MGDFTFSKSQFSKLRQAQDAVREAGLKLALTISPFSSSKIGIPKGLLCMVGRSQAKAASTRRVLRAPSQSPGNEWRALSAKIGLAMWMEHATH